jgi:predicted permease
MRYALRRWRRRPGFALTAIGTLALGIAAATAVFSVVDAVLLRPLPWTSPESLVVVHGVYPNRRNSPATAPTWDRWYISYPGWDALRTSPVFTDVAAWSGVNRLMWTIGDDGTELIRIANVSSAFLPMLGVRLTHGRHFTPEEDNRTTDSIILSNEIWVRYFGGRPDIIGLRVNTPNASSGGRYPRTVVGVLEPGFRFGAEQPDALLPVGIPAEVSRQSPSPSLRILARLAPGASVEAASSAAASLVSAAPNEQRGTARVVSLVDEQIGAARRPLWLLLAAAGLLLLVACSNVAGLLLAEARVRRHEIAVRTALGGSSVRLVRQLLVEHTMLAIAGTLLGLIVSGWLVSALVAIAPEGLPRIDSVVVDVRVAAFAGVTGLVTLLLFGVVPAMSLARVPVSRTLAEGGRDGVASRLLGARTIVVVQMALALVLIIGATLFAETLFRLRAEPLGFQPDGLAVAATMFTGPRYGDPGPIRQFRELRSNAEAFSRFMIRQAAIVNNDLTDRVLARLSVLPGVTAAAGSSAVPFVIGPLSLQMIAEGSTSEGRHEAWRQIVTADYFKAMGIRTIDGRLFGPSDAGDEDVIVVSREFARRFYPDGAVGRMVRQVYGENYELSAFYRIIGVVDDVKRGAFTDEMRPTMYGFDRQAGAITHFLVRTSGDPSAILPAVREAITSVSQRLVITTTATLEDRMARSVADQRFRATLSVLFGTTALALAAVGLYGLAARRAVDRRREFAVRIALGARPSDVRHLVVWDAMWIIGLGVALGVPAAWWAAQVAASMLYGVTATAPHVFSLSAVVLGGVALVATIGPAFRAGHTNPIDVIRN